MNNPFNLIVKDSNSKQIILSSRYGVLIEDLYPSAPKHFLFLIKRDLKDVFEESFSFYEWKELLSLIRLLRKLFIRKYFKGNQILINEGIKQEIPHLHVHLKLY